MDEVERCVRTAIDARHESAMMLSTISLAPRNSGAMGAMFRHTPKARGVPDADRRVFARELVLVLVVCKAFAELHWVGAIWCTLSSTPSKFTLQSGFA